MEGSDGSRTANPKPQTINQLETVSAFNTQHTTHN
jgi:hypothetical protein